MEKATRPVIVIIAFSRTHTLNRIFNSLNMAEIPTGTKLIISIDTNGENQEVADIAEKYEWKPGEKEVIFHKEHLGMRKHYNFCGDLTHQYGSVIILEDDMVISPYFYDFATECLEYYKDTEQIAGLSLYNLPYTEAAKLPFIPLNDNSNVHFLQVPCSLSMCFNSRQWDGFRKWFDTDPDLMQINGLPHIVTHNWSKSSWKKYMYGYMVEKNKFFIYPQLSYSSNFNDMGTNMVSKTFWGQVSLQMVPKKFKFKSFEESLNVYDAYSEILPDRLNRLTDRLKEYDYEVDLYGQKERFSKEYVLTSKKCTSVKMSFERAMKPQELNIVYNIEGEDFKLTRKEDVRFTIQDIRDLILKRIAIEDYIHLFNYYYTSVFDTRILTGILKYRIKKKIRSWFGK